MLITTVNTVNAQNISGIINSYHRVIAIDLLQNKVKLDNVTGLNPDDRVLLIQMKGASVNSSNSSSFGNISAGGNAGNYEFATICGINTDTIIFREDFVNSYDAASQVQVVKVPQYNNVTVTDSLKAQAWDDATGKGGVLVLEAIGAVTLNSGITASGTGFNGGVYYNFGGTCSSFLPATAYYYDLVADGFGSGAYKGEGIAAFISGRQCGKGKQANGGGGGNNHNSGGAGGANYGSGGNGGNQTGLTCNGTNFGVGGASLSSYGYTTGNNRVFMGGGGGAGHTNNNQGVGGGNGGGIIIIRCNNLDAANHTIEANGMQPFNPTNSPNIYEANGDGGGGGGGGGVIIIDAPAITNNLTVQAKGGNGNNSGFLAQCTGPGGGGGGGVIWLKSSSVPVNVTTNVSGGSNGVVKVAACLNNPNGATAGGNGTVVTNYVKPEGTAVTCSVLAINEPLKFSGEIKNSYVQLNWVYSNPSAISKVYLQKSIPSSGFKNLEVFTDFNKPGEHFTDALINNKQLYRLLVLQTDGNKRYSPVLSFTASPALQVKFFPNPVKDKLMLLFNSRLSQNVILTVTDIAGRVCMQTKQAVSRGGQTITTNLSGLQAGTYFIRLNFDGEIFTQKITKQ